MSKEFLFYFKSSNFTRMCLGAHYSQVLRIFSLCSFKSFKRNFPWIIVLSYLFCPFALVSFFRTHFPCSLSFVHTQYVSLFLKSFLPFIYDLQKKFFLPSIFKGLLKNGLFVLVHSSLVSMSEITFIYNSFPEWCHFIWVFLMPIYAVLSCLAQFS